METNSIRQQIARELLVAIIRPESVITGYLFEHKERIVKECLEIADLLLAAEAKYQEPNIAKLQVGIESHGYLANASGKLEPIPSKFKYLPDILSPY
jgi:hypothetical protein